MKRKANVHIIATGGTIAGRAASAAATVGYKAGELTVGQLIASVPGLDPYLGWISWRTFPASSFAISTAKICRKQSGCSWQSEWRPRQSGRM